MNELKIPNAICSICKKPPKYKYKLNNTKSQRWNSTAFWEFLYSKGWFPGRKKVCTNCRAGLFSGKVIDSDD